MTKYMTTTLHIDGLEIIRELSSSIKAKRKDGLIIFLDKFTEDNPDAKMLRSLNRIRLFGSKEDVVMAVATVRAVQIAENYCKKYSPETLASILRQVSIKSIADKYSSTIKKASKDVPSSVIPKDILY